MQNKTRQGVRQGGLGCLPGHRWRLGRGHNIRASWLLPLQEQRPERQRQRHRLQVLQRHRLRERRRRRRRLQVLQREQQQERLQQREQVQAPVLLLFCHRRPGSRRPARRRKRKTCS